MLRDTQALAETNGWRASLDKSAAPDTGCLCCIESSIPADNRSHFLYRLFFCPLRGPGLHWGLQPFAILQRVPGDSLNSLAKFL